MTSRREKSIRAKSNPKRRGESLGDTISRLRHEGYPQEQAVAVAHREHGIARNPSRLTPTSSRMMKRSGDFTPPYHVTVWEERDRVHIALVDSDSRTIVEWWDEEAHEAVEDGFLVPRPRQALEKSAIEYARHMGLI